MYSYKATLHKMLLLCKYHCEQSFGHNIFFFHPVIKDNWMQLHFIPMPCSRKSNFFSPYWHQEQPCFDCTEQPHSGWCDLNSEKQTLKDTACTFGVRLQQIVRENWVQQKLQRKSASKLHNYYKSGPAMSVN